jgi:hypothetical protein
MYHGIIVDLAFTNPKFPESLKLFAKRKSSSNEWYLFGVEVPDDTITQVVSGVQSNMKSDKPYYTHFYNEEEVIVIFKNKVFRVTPHVSTWKPIIEYGLELKIPEEQLDFWPNRFQDEIHYFSKEDFVK